MAATPNSARNSANPRVRLAGGSDVEALAHLINAAFLVERVAFDGDRVDPAKVRGYMNTGTFLVAEDAGVMAGCVYVEMRGGHGYLGLLSVDPPRQGLGLGRQLLAAAEDFARHAGASAMDLRVISPRAELLPFYQRAGYAETDTVPFAPDTASKVRGHYILMSKPLR
jgi:GNAT superfamily N-acetyltransferase